MMKKERKMLLELIGNEQIHMMIKNPDSYMSSKYKELEALKTKVKDWTSKKGKNKGMLININDYDKAKQFYEIVSKVDGEIFVKSGKYCINGKSLMGLLSLDLSHDVFVEINVECGEVKEELIRKLNKLGFVSEM